LLSEFDGGDESCHRKISLQESGLWIGPLVFRTT
jgi:hypothetical protein